MSCVVDSQVGLDRLGGRRLRRRRLEGFDRQQRVDRRRFRLGFRETVAGGERRLFEDADAIDQPIEVLAEPRVRRARRPAIRAAYRAPDRTRPWRARGGRPRAPSGRLRNACPTSRSGSRSDQVSALERELVQRQAPAPEGRPSTVWAPGPDTHPVISRAPRTGTTGRCLLLGIHTDGKEDRPQGNTRAKDGSNRSGSAVYDEGQPACTKTLAASPASRAAGVTIVRSPISSFRPSLTACRTSSSQTNFSGSLRRLGASGALGA